MIFRIDPAVIAAFPATTIGVLVASFDNSTDKPLVDQLKRNLVTLAAQQGITKDHANIKAWREVYATFGVNPKEYRSSVEALVRRTVDNKGLWRISPVVDLYNCISVMSVMPMGGYDIEKLKGRDLTVRYGRVGETMLPLGKTEPVAVLPAHIVWAAGDELVCWLWNYKDAAVTSIDAQTKRAVFFFDAAHVPTHWSMQQALDFFGSCIEAIGGSVHQKAVADGSQPAVTLIDAPVRLGTGSMTYEALLATLPHVVAQTAATPVRAHVPVITDSQEHQIRVAKVAAMRAEGIEPWPAYKPVAYTTIQAREDFTAHSDATKTYTLAGRLLTRRDHGKTFFANLMDRAGVLQLYIKKDDLGELAFEQFKKYVDIGDTVWVSGQLFVTKMGEITLQVRELVLMSKCLYPLPEKFHGLADVEQRYRQRYLDLISNPESREKFKKRSGIVAAIRSFLQEKDFLEVETPMLHPIAGGAAARPFVTHHNAYNMELFLRIAPELYLKRLVVGGFERVFEINRNFRNEGVSTRHNPEFTMLEFYMAHGDCAMGMELVEQLLQDAVERNYGKHQLPFQSKVIDFTAPFKRLTVEQSLVELGGYQPAAITPQAIDSLLQRESVKIHAGAGHGAKLFALFEHAVEAKIVQPTFIIGYPVEVSPLAKRDPQNPELTARFELFICGMEFANGFTELNDPFDQADRFKAQVADRAGGNDEAHHYDADFIHALEYGMAPAVGVGIGIDRLIMMLTDTPSIKDVILFPTLKRV